MSKAKYDIAIADAICEQLATTDKGLKEILAELKKTRTSVPSLRTVHNWRKQSPEFLQAYDDARKAQGVLLFDEARRIAREPLIGQIVTVDPKGTTTKTVDNVERSKLMVLTLLRSAAVFNPDLVEKQQVELSGNLQLAEKISAARKRV